MFLHGSSGNTTLRDNKTPNLAGTSPGSIKVGVINNFSSSKLTPSLQIDPKLAVSQISAGEFITNVTGDTLDVDVLVFANGFYNSDLIVAIQTYLNVQNGHLFLILGENVESQINLLSALNLLELPTGAIATQQAVWYAANSTHPLVRD